MYLAISQYNQDVTMGFVLIIILFAIAVAIIVVPIKRVRARRLARSTQKGS